MKRNIDILKLNTRAAKIVALVKNKKILDDTKVSDNFNNNERILENNIIINKPQPKYQFLIEEDFDDIYKDPDYQNSSSSEIITNPIENENYDLEIMGREIERNISEVIDSEQNITEVIYSEQNTLAEVSSKESSKSRKHKRNTGKEYFTKKGNLIRARKYKELTDCRKKCKNKISPNAQKEIFQKYWSLDSYNSRLLFLNALIDVKPKKISRCVSERNKIRNRNSTNFYSFEIRGNKISVCQKCFLHTIDETEQIVKTVVKKKLESSASLSLDQRGRHRPSNKISDVQLEEIRSHINMFPAYESHYTRERSSKKYLHSDLTLNQMYKLYVENNSTPVSYAKYAEIFHSTGIRFKKPKKDRCNKCEILKIRIDFAESEEEKLKYKEEQKQHHEEADSAYKLKNNDKDFAKINQSRIVLTFDLQKCLPTPYLETSVSFYKRSLWTYNLTVHDCVTGQPTCFMWYESVARRGGNEIASCLLKYLQSISKTNCNNIVLYSDSCAGQNKNAFVSIMFSLYLQENHNIEFIDHKFLVPGHTHMECDVDHSIIERKKKKTRLTIHHPRDWIQFIKTLGSKKVFQVEEMTQESFFNFSSLLKEKFMWRKVDENGNKFNWNSVKWLRYSKTYGEILYKNSLNENATFEVLNIKKRNTPNVTIASLKKCYDTLLPISKQKKNDLMYLNNLIDPLYRDFYKNLPVEGIPDIHPDLVDSSDEE